MISYILKPETSILEDKLNFFSRLIQKFINQNNKKNPNYETKNFNWLKDKINTKFIPSAALILSVLGSKSRLPLIAKAVTSSGDVTKAWVAGLASLRPVKLRLYEFTIVFFSPFLTSFLSHWPMHGPQALAKTVPPNSRRVWAWKYYIMKINNICRLC